MDSTDRRTPVDLDLSRLVGFDQAGAEVGKALGRMLSKISEVPPGGKG